MSRITLNEPSQALPEGWAAVALGEAANAPLQVCVVVAHQPDPVTGHFELLRSTLDAEVFLGCISDRGGRVHEWVELWVETPPEKIEKSDALIVEHQSLRGRDAQRWQNLVCATDRARPDELIRTGWEQQPLPPVAIDLAKYQARGTATFNPRGGRVMVRRHHGRRLEAHLQALAAGKSASEGGSLFLGQQGKAGRLVETLHLKLRALADAVATVADHVQASHLPLLNLGVESFSVDMTDRAEGLPRWWTARIELVESGCATELKVANSQTRFFLATGQTQTSVYSPRSVSASRGRASLRIREVASDSSGNCIVRGTFVTQERLTPSPMDLVWLRLSVGAGPVDLYVRVEREKALAAGEFQFSSVARKLPDQTTQQLISAQGVPFENVSFEHLPLLSTPCDLYALAVLAVRALLVNTSTTLPAALDTVFSLARQLTVEQQKQDDSSALPEVIARVVTGNPRWLEALGPHRLVDDPISPPDAIDLVPATLWWEVLAAIVRAFPGPGKFSRCKHYGDAPPDGLHKVFDTLLHDLRNLIQRSRSLIVVDWRFNREVHAVVRQYLTGLVAQKPPDPTIVSGGAELSVGGPTPLVFSDNQVAAGRSAVSQHTNPETPAPPPRGARRPALKETKG